MRKAIQSKLYRKFLLRHLLILAVTGLLLLLTNIISLSNTYNRLMDNTHRSTAHMTGLLDTRIVDLQKLTLTLSRDTKLLPYQLQEQLQYPYLIADELEKLKALSADLDSIGLFYRNTPYSSLKNSIFTDTGIYTPESYSRLVSDGRISPELLQSKLEQLRSPILLSSLAGDANPEGKEQVLLLLVPLDSTPFSSGIMIYKLNYPALLGNFQQTIDRGSSLIVFDQHNMPFLYLNGSSGLTWSELAAAAQNPESRISGYLFMQETSAKQKFRVVNAIRSTDYFHEYYVALAISLTIFLVSLALGIVLCFRSAHKSYQPIQELSNRFPVLPQDKSTTGNDELSQLTRYIEQMRDESIHLSTMMHNQEVLTRNQLLLAVLMGKLNVDNTTQDNREALHKLFGTRNTSNVVVIIFDDYNAKLSKEPLSEQWLMKHTICNILENLSGVHGVNYALDLAIDNGIVGIISWNNEFADQWEARSRALSEQIIAFMQRHFSLSLSCMIGEPQPTNELHQSFSSATSLAEYRIFAGKQSIITPSEWSQQKMEHATVDERQIADSAEALHAAVCSKDAEHLQLLIQEMEEKFTRLEDAAAFRRTFQQIIFTLNQLVNNIPLSHREAIKYKLESLSEFQSDTVAEACANLLDATRSIQDSLGEDANNNRLYTSILEYVSHNYMDCNLSLSTVAEELSLTPSYITRYFKTKNGLPLMQYVSKIRIEKAKELLETTHLSIKEIVEQVGFVDENNFSRAFRKREGVSPSQYRSNRFS
ncbi:Helix-turn-helix domain-containing protein [Paenibacillus sp. UNCCL117]|uniref:helix-turn-helix transcriptional regulator n=1 Tax=unclassified Paenibacillus TaxID=185978 RepID=UPI0008808948|nr:MULTISPECIES: helix-turn-helix transcriptional regulator [unclassified Paenibacillus]SDE11233.1 Helix-turn-helix domain-containing protein [Paenibacillus sp. cl123]SFW59948.1 Helix-turn-helix domain-containing protein [Paenibacillus sp. UNCCL117]